MNQDPRFSLVGIRPQEKAQKKKPPRYRNFPWCSAAVLALLVLACLTAELWMTKDPTYLDLEHFSVAPNGEFLFGTDSLGRDIFSGILYGGRISLMIGFFSTAIATAVAIVYGAVSGLAPQWLDTLMSRFLEAFLSVPGLLLVLFLQAVFGDANVVSLSLVIGLTSWPAMARVVRTEVRVLGASGYVVASRCMRGGFFHVLWRHLTPNFLSSIMFMVVMNVRGAIATESTLSFLGLGLPLEIISWGSMLSLAEKALLSGSWWMILIPGGFLVVLLLCLTNLGDSLRKASGAGQSNL